MTGQLAAKISHLSKSFDKGATFAVNDISFEVVAGQTIAIAGGSGSGKSTLGRCLVGLLEFDAGEIDVLGKNMALLKGKARRKFRRNVQLVFQNPYAAVNPRMKTIDWMSEGLMLHENLSQSDAIDSLKPLISRVGLRISDLERQPQGLSGGQLQRAVIARAMSLRPALVVLDEPTASLDASLRMGVLRMIEDLQAESGASFVLISHDLESVKMLSERVMIMRQGSCVEHGLTNEVLRTPVHQYTQLLVESQLKFGTRRR